MVSVHVAAILVFACLSWTSRMSFSITNTRTLNSVCMWYLQNLLYRNGLWRKGVEIQGGKKCITGRENLYIRIRLKEHPFRDSLREDGWLTHCRQTMWYIELARGMNDARVIFGLYSRISLLTRMRPAKYHEWTDVSARKTRICGWS